MQFWSNRLHTLTSILFIAIILIIAASCSTQPEPISPEVSQIDIYGTGEAWVGEPVNVEPEIPKGILIKEIPASADIIFSSIRYVLNDAACLDENYELKKNFILDSDCNKAIYDSEAETIASLKQLFFMDFQSGEVIQITNTDCTYMSGQVVDATTIMTNAVCADTNNDGKINDKGDLSNLYLLNLTTGELDCLTCGMGLEAINNPDYSPINGKIVFSAREGDASNPNYLFTIDTHKNLVQVTNDGGNMDFDCAWSEDATKIVFNRLPAPSFSKPSQVWLMDSDGANKEKITDGGSNPDNEGPLGVFQIGIDVDPDLSPDNSQIVFSRLKTSKDNEPFGVWELIIVDVATKKEEVLDSIFANMIPEWKPQGIIFIRQVGSSNPVGYRQGLCLYKDGIVEELETFPFNAFPIGAFSVSWIELNE